MTDKIYLYLRDQLQKVTKGTSSNRSFYNQGYIDGYSNALRDYQIAKNKESL